MAGGLARHRRHAGFVQDCGGEEGAVPEDKALSPPSIHAPALTCALDRSQMQAAKVSVFTGGLAHLDEVKS